MLVVHVHVHVKPEWVEAFKQATIENASNSVQEPGIARFEFATATRIIFGTDPCFPTLLFSTATDL